MVVIIFIIYKIIIFKLKKTNWLHSFFFSFSFLVFLLLSSSFFILFVYKKKNKNNHHQSSRKKIINPTITVVIMGEKNTNNNTALNILAKWSFKNESETACTLSMFIPSLMFRSNFSYYLERGKSIYSFCYKFIVIGVIKHALFSLFFLYSYVEAIHSGRHHRGS